MTFPFIGFVESNEDKPYSDSKQFSNDKPHEVYCEHCEYSTEVHEIMGPKCGRCHRYLITVVQRKLPNGFSDTGETQD